MTSFTVEAVKPRFRDLDRADLLLQVVLDNLPDTATQAQIDGALTSAICGELRRPKTADTVRRRLFQFWPMIAGIADREPDAFDQIILEYADRITTIR
jgi:hypothetical protein